MQPLKLTIPGRYWDSQIYAGRLYLFERDGGVRTIDWDHLIEGWELEKPLKLAMECAFRRSDYLYGSQWSLAFSDEEIRAVIQNKFERLATLDLEVSTGRMREVSVAVQNSPFPVPHSDSTIYKKNLYVATTEGVFRATCNKRGKNPISSRPEKKWDAPTQAVTASYNSLALAAGDEGLFEFALEDNWRAGRRAEPVQLEKRNCTGCNWAFQSIFCSSHLNSGFLASFKKERENQRRVFDEVVPAEQIFHHAGYSWGNRDKLCQVREHIVSITRYTPWAEEEERMENLGAIDFAVDTVPLALWKGGVVSGAVAAFGTIIECENAVVIAPSEGRPITVPGEPVNWRVFPRSVQYENQLHLIYDDRLDILSFNQDYFVDQNDKVSGTRFWKNPTYRSVRNRERYQSDEDLD